MLCRCTVLLSEKIPSYCLNHKSRYSSWKAKILCLLWRNLIIIILRNLKFKLAGDTWIFLFNFWSNICFISISIIYYLSPLPALYTLTTGKRKSYKEKTLSDALINLIFCVTIINGNLKEFLLRSSRCKYVEW